MDQYADGNGPLDGTTFFNPRLAGLRTNHLNELSDPGLRSFATRALIAEGGVKGLANNFEQLSNYANARGIGIKQALTSGFYGPVNRGALPSSLDPDAASAADQAINSVFKQGRNKLEYRIDQGMKGDPNYGKEQDPRFRPANIDGNFFADHPEIAPGWASKQLALDDEFKKTGGSIADRQFEDGPAIAAINSAAGIKTPAGPGALSFASTGNKNRMPSPALSADDAQGPGALSDNSNKPDVYGGLMQIAASLAGVSSPSQANALTAMAQANRKQQGAWSYQVMPNGQLLATNSQGAVKVMGKAGDYSKDDTFSPIMGKDDSGNPTMAGTFNRNTGEYKPVGGGMQPQQPVPTTPEDLAAIDPQRAQAAKDVFEGRVDLPKGSRLNPVQNQLRKDVLGVYPGIDENKLAARRQFLTDDAKSAPQSFGGILDKTGTALGLLEDVADHYGSIGNTTSSLGSYASQAENYVTSGGVKQGSLRQKLDVAAQNAAADINSLQNAGRGSVAEREHIKDGLFLPYASPTEQAGALQGHIDTLKKAVDTKFEHEAKIMGEDYVKNDPRYQNYVKRLDVLQQKADSLYKGDFSYAKGGLKSAEPEKGSAPALPKGVKSIQLIQPQ